MYVIEVFKIYIGLILLKTLLIIDSYFFKNVNLENAMLKINRKYKSKKNNGSSIIGAIDKISQKAHSHT